MQWVIDPPRLKTAIGAKAMSMNEIGTEADLSPRTIARLVQAANPVPVRPSTVRKIARVLGVDLEAIGTFSRDDD